MSVCLSVSMRRPVSVNETGKADYSKPILLAFAAAATTAAAAAAAADNEGDDVECARLARRPGTVM